MGILGLRQARREIQRPCGCNASTRPSETPTLQFFCRLCFALKPVCYNSHSSHRTLNRPKETSEMLSAKQACRDSVYVGRTYAIHRLPLSCVTLPTNFCDLREYYRRNLWKCYLYEGVLINQTSLNHHNSAVHTIPHVSALNPLPQMRLWVSLIRSFINSDLILDNRGMNI